MVVMLNMVFIYPSLYLKQSCETKFYQQTMCNKIWPILYYMWARAVTLRRYWRECISFMADNTSNAIIICWYVILDVSRNGKFNVKYGSFSTNRKLDWLLTSTWWISTILFFFQTLIYYIKCKNKVLVSHCLAYLIQEFHVTKWFKWQ